MISPACQTPVNHNFQLTEASHDVIYHHENLLDTCERNRSRQESVEINQRQANKSSQGTIHPMCSNATDLAQPELCGANPAGDQQCVALFSPSKWSSLTRVSHLTNPSPDERSSPESNHWRPHRRTLGPLRTSQNYEIIILVLLAILPLKKATWVCGMQTQLWVKVTCVTLHSTPTSSSRDWQHDLWVRYFYFCIHEKNVLKGLTRFGEKRITLRCEQDPYMCETLLSPDLDSEKKKCRHLQVNSIFFYLLQDMLHISEYGTPFHTACRI